MFNANPQRLENADGSRWATGRTVKGETSDPHRKQAVEIWTLKCRNAAGKAIVTDTYCSRLEAEEWIAAAPLTADPRPKP